MSMGSGSGKLSLKRKAMRRSLAKLIHRPNHKRFAVYDKKINAVAWSQTC